MATRRIEAPDIHHLNSAIGWLELGNHTEAYAELEKISFLTRYHPDVLIVRWKVVARAKDWVRSLDIARALVRITPDKATGWICLAYSLYNTKQNGEAWSHLLTAEKRFPEISAIPYFLACLACQMGKTDEATKWLSRWNGMVKGSDMKATARKDPRLQPIWQEFDDALLEENEGRPAS
ncbi:tetratricopeptide repeat protein [bacterium]|nr:tetratricopeptide repeat protein [bacterium]